MLIVERIDKTIAAHWQSDGPVQQRLENAISNLLRNGSLEAFTSSLLDNPALADEVAERSFDHPTGASKMVISSLGEQWPQLRVHFWPPTIEATGNELSIHDHRWDFISNVLVGSLHHEIYQRSDVGPRYDLVVFRKQKKKAVYDTNTFDGMHLKLDRTEELIAGQTYFFSNEVHHRLTNRSKKWAATLFLRGPYMKDSTEVFHEEGSAIVKGSYPCKMSSATLKLRANQLARTLRGTDAKGKRRKAESRRAESRSGH